MMTIRLGWAMVVGMVSVAGAQKAAYDPIAGLAKYDVVWHEMGNGPDDSMPLGNGDIGLNVWTEANGDLVFYIGKSDAWSETPSRSLGLLKVGRVRVSLEPKPAVGAGFEQALRLKDSEIVVKEGGATLRVWVDANRAAIHVEAKSATSVGMKVSLEDWRLEPNGNITADVIEKKKDAVEWYHRNGPKSEPHTRDYTWGALLRGPGMRGEGMTLTSDRAGTMQSVTVTPLTLIDPNEKHWMQAVERLADATDAVPLAKAWADHVAWWDSFWWRSWIDVDAGDQAFGVTQGYVLQRYMTAAAGRGAQAIKYNGSLFVVDNPHVSIGRDANKKDIFGAVTADYRGWGGQYWFQNTRPIYWPLLQMGDFDIMQPLFKQYLGEIRNNAPTVETYYHHDGSYFAETSAFWGAIPNLPPEKDGKYTDFYFTPVLELSMMMLDYYEFTGDKAFVQETLLPISSQGIEFFDKHWKRDAEGKLLLDPDNAIEMYWKVHDPSPDIAGLQAVLPRLLALPKTLTTVAERAQWTRMLGELPPLPVGEKDGKRVLLPYTGPQDQPSHNTENPELYAIYPFRLFGLGKPELQMAKDTFDARKIKATGCWVQDPEQAAYLGMTELAKKDVSFNLQRKDKRMKFPAFWDIGHDYIPDVDNGGNGQIGLQRMLMQTEGKRILLLPAWPADWSADFKLHAPLQTIVEGRVEGGKVVRLKVTPESRRKDVEMSSGRL
jgi:alpha-L-fucosidase 2